MQKKYSQQFATAKTETVMVVFSFSEFGGFRNLRIVYILTFTHAGVLNNT